MLRPEPNKVAIAMTEPGATQILTEERGTIFVITLNRREAKNAMNSAMALAIANAIDHLDGTDHLSVGIITGAGGSFCSGMDLKDFLKGNRPSIPGRGFGGLVQAPPAKPLIAAVDGFALAGGMELALACDLIIANKQAMFGIPEVKRGLAAGAGGLIRMPRQMPYRIAMEYALTGEFFSAQRAYELGLVNRLTDGPAIEGAKILAEAISKNGPLAIKASKKTIVELRLWTDEQMWTKQQDIMAPIFASSDAREGAAAFAEKRAPNWSGK